MKPAVLAILALFAAQNYDAIVRGDARAKLNAIDAALGEYLAERISSRQTPAETAFAYGPIVRSGRPVDSALVAALLTAAADVDGRVRREAILTLGSIGPMLDTEQARVLVGLLTGHHDPATREAAAATAGRLRVPSAGDALIDAINDRDPRVKAAAMRALGELRYDRAVQALNGQLAHYRRGDLALAAFEGLAGIAHVSSIDWFQRALGDREASARRLAAEGLGRSGQTGAVPALEAAIKNEREAFARLAMAFALCRLGQPYHHRLVEGLRATRTAPQAFAYFLELESAGRPTLEDLSRDPDERIRRLALRALERLKPQP